MSNGLIELPNWSEPDPDDARIESLVASLALEDGPADDVGIWPEGLWQLLVKAGATRWSLPLESGGQPCSRPLLVQRYARLASGSLTAAFILSQHDAAVRRLSGAASREEARRWLHAIGSGQAFATVGISQLTTSRRLGAQALLATETGPGTPTVFEAPRPGSLAPAERTSSSPAPSWKMAARCSSPCPTTGPA